VGFEKENEIELTEVRGRKDEYKVKNSTMDY
jgi:hypothetical protein